VSPRLVAAAIGGSLVLAGCTSLGGNIKGSFSCAAPDGVCAPSSVIDDRALAMISGTADVVPAGPYTPAQDAIGTVRVAGTTVGRTNQKVLKIVFPAHVDRQGRFHETSAVRAVVDNGAWLAAAKPAEAPHVAVPQELAVNDVPALATVDLATAVALAPVAAVAPPPSISREGLRAEVDQLLARPASSGTSSQAPASIAPQAASPVAKPALPTVAAAHAPAAVNRPASFSGIVEE
jgi:conjugal transfer pilus assembly protein TraV